MLYQLSYRIIRYQQNLDVPLIACVKIQLNPGLSNRAGIFFLFLFIFHSGTSARAAIFEDSSTLAAQAEQAFLYENYAEAVQKYTQLLESGQDHQAVLYRLAYLHEQLGETAAALYYLRRLQWADGRPMIDQKIISLLEQPDRSIPEGDAPANWVWLSVRHRMTWMGTCLGLLALALLLLRLRRWRFHTVAALCSASSALVLALFLLIAWQGYAPRAVLVMPTPFYAEPAYGAEQLSLPLSAGSVVRLGSRRDIWQQIESKGKQAWVPAFALALLHE